MKNGQIISSDVFRVSESLKKLPINSEHNEQLKFQHDRYQLTNFLKIYFDFAYFLGMSPFRFGRDTSSGDIILKQFWIQKVS